MPQQSARAVLMPLRKGVYAYTMYKRGATVNHDWGILCLQLSSPRACS